MPKTKNQKAELVKFYSDRIAERNSFIVVRPKGLTANESVELKKSLHAVGADFRVIKNTLFKLALNENKLPAMSELEAGENAIIFAGEDITSTAKKLDEYAKKFAEKLEALGGLLDGSLLTKAQVAELVDMPSFEVLIAQIAGLLTLPAAGIANVLEDAPRGVVSVIDQAFTEEK